MSTITIQLPRKITFRQLLSSTAGAALIFALLVIIIFGQFIFSDNMLFSSDQMNGLDSKVVMQTSLLKHHQFPLWFPSRLGGMPTIDALFGDAFYPPSAVVTLFSSIPRSIGFKMLLHIFLAGLFFYLLLRKGFRMNQLVSCTGAIFYMFNPQFFSHIYPGHDGKLYVIAWLPFIIWQLKELLTTPRLVTACFVGLGIGMSILTSQLQMTYFVLWGAFIYWCTALGIRIFKKEPMSQLFRPFAYFWLAVLLGLGMGAIQIFPSALYIGDAFSVRGAERGFEFASSWSLHWPEFFSLWVPELANTLDYYWGQNPFKLNSEYAVMVPIVLSVFAIAISPKNPWRILWGSVAVLTALFALGAHTPVFHIAYYLIPGVKKFRAASMIMFWFSFSTILLSALFLKDIAAGALQQLKESSHKQWSKGIFIAAGCCLALTLLFSVQGFVKGFFQEALLASGKSRVFEVNFQQFFVPSLWLWFMFSISLLALIRAALNGKLSAPVIVSIILVIGIIDIIRIDAKFIKTISSKPYFAKDATINRLTAEMQQAPFRCYTLPGSLPSNGEGIHGLEGLGGFHDNELTWYRTFRGDQQDKNYLSSLISVGADGQPYLRSEMLTGGNPFLDIANAKYLLARNGSELLAIPNRNALERISFVAGYTVLDSAAVVPALKNGTYDYRRQVALLQEPKLPEGFSAGNDPAEAAPLALSWNAYTPNYRKATITAPADGFLRIAEVFYPGWKIRVDGKETVYYQADGAWMALPVRAGQHTVELLPHSHYLAKFIPVSVMATLFMIVVWVSAAVRSRRKEHEGA